MLFNLNENRFVSPLNRSPPAQFPSHGYRSPLPPPAQLLPGVPRPPQPQHTRPQPQRQQPSSASTSASPVGDKKAEKRAAAEAEKQKLLQRLAEIDQELANRQEPRSSPGGM
eukprot:gene12661-biopygen5088